MINLNGIYNTGFDLNLLLTLGEKPPIHTLGVEKFWDDEHISASMLKAHLDPNMDSASRLEKTIDKAVAFIAGTVGLNPQHKMIDLGCGPGLYTQRFYQYTQQITGMDYSRRSIGYAKDYAQEHQMTIEYIYQNYLTLEYEEVFDLVTLIYLDLFVPKPEDRSNLLRRIHRSLKVGGYFIFDVPTKYEANLPVRTTWEAHDSGFFKATPHLLLTTYFKYDEEKTNLDQYVVLDEKGNTKVYRIYLSYYTLEEIIEYISGFGFEVQSYYEDLTGKPHTQESETIALIVRKVK